MKVVVDVDKCVGVGRCVEAAPDVFAQNEDDGLVRLLEEYPKEDRHEAVRTAARLCPVLAIKLLEKTD